MRSPRVSKAVAVAAVLLGAAAALAAPVTQSPGYLKGVELMKAQRYREAIPLFEGEARRNPGSADILMNLGWAYWHIHDYEQSWKVWDLLSKLDPKNPTYMRLLADLDIERANYPAALKLADRALAVLPGNRDASLVKAKALLHLGRPKEAVKILDDLLRRFPDSPAVLFANADYLSGQGKLEESLVLYDRLVRLDSTTPAYRRSRATVLYRLGRYEEAISEWSQLAARNPPDEKSMMNLGWAAWHDRKYDEALAWGKKLVAAFPQNPLYLRFLANIDLELGDDGSALDLTDQALELRPDDKDLRLLKAKALFHLQRDDEALGVLAKLLDQYPDDPKLEFNMGDFLAMMDRNEEALKYFDKLIAEYPDNLAYHKHRAQSYYALGQFDKAVAEWKWLTEKSPFDPMPYQKLITDAVNNGSWEDALYWERELAGVRPLDGTDWLRLARIYYAMHLLPQALEAAQKGYETEPTLLANLFFVADLLEEMQRYRDARAVLEQLLRLNPNSERALWSLARIYEGLGDRKRAIRVMGTLARKRFSKKNAPPYIALYQARLMADMGKIEKAWRTVKKLNHRDRSPVPILLYHSVAKFKRSDQVDETLFRAQMQALKDAGYHPVFVSDMSDFFDGRKALPPKPILITFDDGRIDAFRNATPILKETGMKATMFVIVGGINGAPFHAGLGDLRKYQSSGLWQLQYHANEGHGLVPIDPVHKSPFLANRMWLAQKGRLETHEEAQARIENDARTGVEKFLQYFPNMKGKPLGFALPFGEAGQEDYTNDPGLDAVNERIIDQYFRFGFVQSQWGFNLPNTKRSEAMRFEVPKDMTPRQLMRHLQVDDPWVRLKMAEGQLWIESGQPMTALKYYDQVHRYGVTVGDFTSQWGLAYERVGNPYYARKLYAKAIAYDPGNERYQMLQDQSKANARPHVGSTGYAFSDSDSRANYLGKLQTDASAGPVNISAWGGPGQYHQSGFANVRSKEAGAGMQIFPLSKLRLDGDFSRRDFLNGANRIDNNYDGSVNVLAFHGASLTGRTSFANEETAPAIQQGIHYHDYGGGLAYDLGMNWYLTGNYDRLIFNDGNREFDARGQLTRKLNSYLSLGYQFWAGNSNFENQVIYWTPKGLVQHMGILGVDLPLGRLSETTGRRTFDGTFQYGAGYGQDAGTHRVVQEFSAGVLWHLTDIFSFNLNGQYLDTANYTSRTVNAGISLTY